MSDPSAVQQIFNVITSIPSGRVTTYGLIADLVDGATVRSVGHALKTDGHGAPWWRVVNAKGRPAPGAEKSAHQHFVDEGTPLTTHEDATYAVDMTDAA